MSSRIRNARCAAITPPVVTVRLLGCRELHIPPFGQVQPPTLAGVTSQPSLSLAEWVVLAVVDETPRTASRWPA